MFSLRFFKKKFQKKPNITVSRFEPQTRQPSILSKTTSITVNNGEDWNPFSFKVKSDHFEDFYHQFLFLRELCLKNGYTFALSPPLSGLASQGKYIHVYMDAFHRENIQVFDIDLFLNEQQEVDSFALLTRDRYYAFSGEPPYLISRSPLNLFDQAVFILTKHFEK